MPAYRYVKIVEGDPPETPPREAATAGHLDVTFVAGTDRDVLDASMEKLGYRFSHVVEGSSLPAPSFAFPGAVAPPVAPRAAAAVTAELVTDARLPALGPPSDAPEAAPSDRSPPRRRALTLALSGALGSARERGRERAVPAAMLGLAVLAALLVHSRATESHFTGEDYARLLDARAVPFIGYLTARFDGLFIGSYELVWAAAARVLGMNAEWYFRLGLLHHLVNVAVVFGVARALTRRPGVAAVAATLWGVTPGFQPTLQSLPSHGALLAVTAFGWALLELTRAARGGRAPSALALVRANVALVVGAGAMPGAWLAAAGFPVIAALLLPTEGRPARAAAGLAPAAVASLLPAVAFGRGLLELSAPLGIVRLFFELLAYGTSMTVAGPFTTVHASGHGMGLFAGPTYGLALIVSGVVAALTLALIVWRAALGGRDAVREVAALLLLATMLYAGLAVSRGELLAGRGADWVAARTLHHYAANVPIVLALAGLAGRVRRAERAPVWRTVALGVVGLSFVLSAASVSREAHALRPSRTGKLTEYVDMALEELVASAPEGAPVFIQNDEFPPLARASARGLDPVRFPGVGAYWALVHGAPVPLPDPAPSTGSASAAPPTPAPAPAPTSRTRRRPRPKADAPAEGTVLHGARSEGRVVRFVVMDYDALRKIYDRYPASISEYFVTPAAVNRAGASVLALEGASAETRELLDKARRALARVNDL